MIRVEHVSKRYDRLVLEDVNLTVPTGALLGLVGPGGSGKSVLLKSMAGLIEVDDGRIFFDSESLRYDDATLRWWQQRIGMVFQNNALFDFLTVGQNVAFPMEGQGFDPHELRERAALQLHGVGLRGFAPRAVAGLSGGQQKRVAVARATITEAPFLLLDEPAAGLDPVTSQKIFDLLRREQQSRGSTCVIVSSDIERLKRVSDRIAMLYRGQLVFEGSNAEAEATDHPLVRQFLDGVAEGPLA